MSDKWVTLMLYLWPCPRMINTLPIIIIITSISLIIGSHFFLVLPRLLGLRLALATDLGASGNAWIGIILVIVYIGGIMVLFTYFLTLTRGQPLKLKYSLILLPVLVFDNYIPASTISVSPSMLINYFLTPVFIFTVVWLFLAIVVVVKVTYFASGPLRVYVV